MNYASTFLSYSRKDAQIVHAVADELCKRGILVWLDKNELEPGRNLTEALNQAIKAQNTVTLFVSSDALQSAWVEQELKQTLEIEEKIEHKERIIPVYLDDPLKLVQSHHLLSQRWLHSDGDRVDKNGIIPDITKNASEITREVAEKISSRIYSVLKISEAGEVIIYLDQRGVANRKSEPVDIPLNIQRINAPTLVFRPDHNERSRGELITGKEWENMRETIYHSISTAFRGVRWGDFKKIKILGNAQLSLPFLMGQIFDRSSSADLYCSKGGEVFNNKGQNRLAPLEGGNPNCEKLKNGIEPIFPGKSIGTVSLLLSTETYVDDVQKYLAAHPDSPPLVWVESGRFSSSEQVMAFVADVVALLRRLKTANNVHSIHLYCGLPFHAVSLLAANLLHVVKKITFMEYVRGATKDKEMYIPLEMLSQN